jgi:hypothetical protein
MQPEEEAPAHRQNGKAEEPKRPACSLQPTRSENNQKPATTRTDGDENRLQKIKGDK